MIVQCCQDEILIKYSNMLSLLNNIYAFFIKNCFGLELIKGNDEQKDMHNIFHWKGNKDLSYNLIKV